MNGEGLKLLIGVWGNGTAMVLFPRHSPIAGESLEKLVQELRRLEQETTTRLREERDRDRILYGNKSER